MIQDHLPNLFNISPHPRPSPPVGEGKQERGLIYRGATIFPPLAKGRLGGVLRWVYSVLAGYDR